MASGRVPNNHDHNNDRTGNIHIGHGQHKGPQTQDKADGIHEQHCLPLTQAKGQKPVVQMPLVRLEDRFPVTVPPQDGKSRIHNRQAQRYRRHDQRNGGRALYRAENSNRRQHKADKHTARISHKNGSRVKIVMDKAEDAPCQGCRQRSHRIIPLMDGYQDDCYGSNAGYPGRQTVQTVDQVHYINETDDPEDRKGYRQVFQIKIPAKGVVQPFDLNIPAGSPKGHG